MRERTNSSAEALVAHLERLKTLASRGRRITDSAAGRALAILELVAKGEEPLAAADLAPKLGLPKATVHRLAVLLEHLGFLQREPGTKRFIVGSKLEAVALDTLIHSSRRGERHAILQALVDEVGETCNVTVLDGNEVVYIDRVESHWPLRTHFQPGSRVPLHCGASGKVFLSLMPARKRRHLLTAAPLKRFTEKTVVDPKTIEEKLKRVRSTQVGLDVEEFLPGLIGLAVPVFDPSGRVCATVSMHAPTARLDVQQVLACVPALKRAAVAIGQTLDRSPERRGRI
jgi:DNA-binding IclR family transcriptional regulator